MRKYQNLCSCGEPKNKSAERCRNCWKEDLKNQTCVNGHNTKEVGRSSSGNCNECQRERMQTPEYKEYQSERRDNLKKPCPDCGEYINHTSEKCRPCWGKSIRGEDNHLWKGGRIIKQTGYVDVWAPGHPRRKGNYVSEHVLVMEDQLRRYLLPGENVHHINGVRNDNRIENLELWVSNQPSGQRPEDLLQWAEDILRLYSDFDHINGNIKLDFNDVLIEPKLSSVSSRRNIELTRSFTFLYSTQTWAGVVPILASNMLSVCTPKVAHKMAEYGMMSCLPKTTRDQFIGINNTIPSIGLQDDIEKIKSESVCLDVPTAYLDIVIDKTREIRELYPDIVLIVGNVVTKEGVTALLMAGADVIKVGIGAGSACSTRTKTGIGYPQLSAIVECSKEAHRLGGLIISDGGCIVPGDLAKAFGAGADFVMLGGMLAGHGPDNGTDFYGMSSERANNEFAGGLKDYRTSEGWEMVLDDKGPIENTLQDILGGLRSACSYVGASTISEFPQKVTFIQVNRQANTSLLNYRI